MNESTTLTPVEHELMQILWKLGEGSVSDVMIELPENRDLAYTSVSTILRILEQKKIVKTRKENRKHIYIPLIKESDFQHSAVNRLVKQIFSGNSAHLVNYLLDDSQLTFDEIKEIKNLINQKMKVTND